MITGTHSEQLRERLVIESGQRTRGVDWRELWTHRELLLFFVWRDLKVKYRQTLLGAAWAVLVPLVHMVVFSVIFGTVAGFPTDDIPKPLFYYSAMLPWTYFAASFRATSNSLVGNAHFLTKIYLPRLLVPLAPCISALVDFVIAFIILVGMMLFYAVAPTPWGLLVVPLMLISMLAAFGSGLLFASLQVRYRDIRYVTPFVIQIWMYCSVIVPFSAIAERFGRWAWIYGLNPMAGVVEAMRWSLMHEHMGRGVQVAEQTVHDPGQMPVNLLLLGLPAMLLMLVAGIAYFRRVEDQFADIV